jgi:hypothetical protein
MYQRKYGYIAHLLKIILFYDVTKYKYTFFSLHPLF